MTVPADINLLCARSSWHDTFEKCKSDDENELRAALPACEAAPNSLQSERRPVHFLQLYWHSLSCALVDLVWSLQLPAYQADNSPGGIEEFRLFGASHHGFQVTGARNSMVPAGPETGVTSATAEVELLFFRRSDNDPTKCWIDYVLVRSTAADSCTIAETESDGDC